MASTQTVLKPRLGDLGEQDSVWRCPGSQQPFLASKCLSCEDSSRCMVLHTYPHPRLSSHAASKVGRRGVGDEVMCGPSLPGRDMSHSDLHARQGPSVLLLPCPLGGPRGHRRAFGLPWASAAARAVGTSFVRQMGTAFQFSQQSPKLCFWPDA